MDVSMIMNSNEQARVSSQTTAFNQALSGSDRTGEAQELGRDDFLKILLTQLQNQDPTNPMEDREFIGQMAQFSALEQMTNVATGFTELNNVLTAGRALNVLGRTVEVRNGTELERGTVSAVTQGPSPQITINNRDYDFAAVERIIH